MTNEIRINRSMTLEDMDTELSTALGATAEQFWQENKVRALLRERELSKAEGDPIVTPSGIRYQNKTKIDKKNAEKQIADARVDLQVGEQGITQEALDILIQRKREENKRQELIRSAPEGFWSGAAQLATGFAVSMADPVNIAAAFIPVVGTARYTSMLAKAQGVGGRAAVRLKVGAAAGIVGEALVEPLVLYPMLREQADYGLYDSLLNITFGGVLGGGLHAGAGAIGDVIAKASPQAKSDMLQGAVAQMLDEGEIDVSKIAESHDTFMSSWDELENQRAVFQARDTEITTIIEELKQSTASAPNRVERKQMLSELNNSKRALDQAREELKAVQAKSSKKFKKEGLKKSVAVNEAKAKVSELERSVKLNEEFVNSGELMKADKADITRLQQDIIPERFKERVAKAEQSVKRVTSTFKANPQQAPKQPELEIPETKVQEPTTQVAEVETETQDILTAIEESGQFNPEELSSLRASLSEVEQTNVRDLEGIKAGVLCGIGQ